MSAYLSSSGMTDMTALGPRYLTADPIALSNSALYVNSGLSLKSAIVGNI